MIWTESAKECYFRGCQCHGCFYDDFFAASQKKCQMKSAVMILVRTIGAPGDRVKLDKVSRMKEISQERIIEILLREPSTIQHIADCTGLWQAQVGRYLKDLIEKNKVIYNELKLKTGYKKIKVFQIKEKADET